MNIFLAFLQSKVIHPIPAYSFWEYYIKNGIEESGDSWVEADVDWAEGLVHASNNTALSAWKTQTWERALSTIKAEHKKEPISFFLSYLYPHQIVSEAIKEIQALGIPCINFFCDNVREYTKPPKEFAVFDLNWVPEYKALAMYRKAQYNFIHLPMPMWVAPHYRIQQGIEANEISFIGSKDILRTLLFEEAIRQGINLKIYGAGWLDKPMEVVAQSSANNGLKTRLNNQTSFIKKYGLSAYLEKLKQRNRMPVSSEAFKAHLFGKINFDDYISITQQSMVTLGVNRYPSFTHSLKKPNTYSRLRDIEAPMLGACYLTEYTAGLEELYVLGHEIETYSTIEEMVAKIEKLQKDRAYRTQLRNACQKKALNEHSIINSLAKIKVHLQIK